MAGRGSGNVATKEPEQGQETARVRTPDSRTERGRTDEFHKVGKAAIAKEKESEAGGPRRLKPKQVPEEVLSQLGINKKDTYDCYAWRQHAQALHDSESSFYRTIGDLTSARGAITVDFACKAVVAYAVYFPQEFLERMDDADSAGAGRLVAKFVSPDDISKIPMIKVRSKPFRLDYQDLKAVARKLAED